MYIHVYFTQYKMMYSLCQQNEPPPDKTSKMAYAPNEDSDQAGHRPVWSESSLCAHLVAKDPRCCHADSEDSDQMTTPWVLL